MGQAPQLLGPNIDQHLHSQCGTTASTFRLAVRPAGDGPLFIMPQGIPLTKATFVKKITEVLEQVGIDASHYKGHSFRIGAATTAAACGLNEVGRWVSSAYQSYIRLPPTDRANISAILIIMLGNESCMYIQVVSACMISTVVVGSLQLGQEYR